MSGAGQTGAGQDAASAPVYTFLGVRGDGRVPAVEVRACSDDGEALRQAAGWLADHSSCQTVEVWRDGELIGRRTLGPGAT